MVASRFACTVGAIRAKLPQRRVRFAANRVRNVRGRNQAGAPESLCLSSLLTNQNQRPGDLQRSPAIVKNW